MDGTMKTIQIKHKDIPLYLQAGEFYRNLENSDPDGVIDIPVDFFYVDEKSVTDLLEFARIIQTTMYWMLDDIPPGIVRYCSETNITVWRDQLKNLSHQYQPDLFRALPNAFCEHDRVDYSSVVNTGNWELMVRVAAHMGKQSKAATIAAQLGHLPLLTYLREEGFHWDSLTCSNASSQGHLDCLTYAHENGCPWDYRVYVAAAYNGHVQCMQYAHEQGLEWHVRVCIEAAYSGELTCLEYAHRNGCPWDSMTLEQAARFGHVQCLHYALQNGCPQSEKASNLACTGSKIECLRLLHQYNTIWSTKTCVEAVAYSFSNNIDCLHENGCPWDEGTPRMCARKGKFISLKYALQGGCVYDNSLLQDAAFGGSMECVKYLVEDHLLHMNEKVYYCALLNGHLDYLQYLLDQGCPSTNVELEYNSQSNAQQFTNYRYCSEYMPCVELAVMRGWQPSLLFIKLLQKKGFKGCDELMALMEREGWLEQSEIDSFLYTTQPPNRTTVGDNAPLSTPATTPPGIFRCWRRMFCKCLQI